MFRKSSNTLTVFLIIISFVAVGVYLWSPWDLKGIGGTLIEDFTKVDEYPLYTARYVGDYRLDEYLETGVRPRLRGIGCTNFVKDLMFGRNFDFPANPALLLWTYPDDGYRSVSMVDLGYFGYSMENQPKDSEGLEGAPYLPFDGMNEMGFVVGMAAVPYADTLVSSDKVSIGEIEVIRLLLDYAADVEEAIELLSEYNVVMTDPPIHYLVADASGESVIIEFTEGEMKLFREDKPQIITNFLVTGQVLPDESPCMRYYAVYNGMESLEGDISVNYAFELLDASSQSSTIWSVVYDLKHLTVHVVMGRDYSDVHSFELDNS